MEKVSSTVETDYRYYIYGVDGLAAVQNVSGTTPTTDYVLSDQEGSISSLLTSTGSVTVDESFTAYGNRREASTWSGPPSSTEEGIMDGITRQGFTGQTVLGQMELNHMNGRVEDAVTGTFLSPDPYVTDPYNTQDYYRYAYAYNSPLVNIDRSGFDTEPPFVPDPGVFVLITACPFGETTFTEGGATSCVSESSFDPGLAAISFSGEGAGAFGGGGSVTFQKSQQNGPCSPPPLSTASNRSYNPSDPATHHYSVSTSVSGLTATQAAQLLDLWRNGPNAAPGILPNTPDFTPVLLANLPYTPNTNWIYIQPINNGWINVTLPGHYFYSGTVTNTMNFANGTATLNSTGTGNTSRWVQNDALGAVFFKASQLEAIYALSGLPRVRVGAAGSCNNPQH